MSLLDTCKQLLYYYDAFRGSCPIGPTERSDIAAAKAAIANYDGEVVIGIQKGAPWVVRAPEGVTVKIMDYDVDMVDEDVLETDFEGDKYQEIDLS